MARCPNCGRETLRTEDWVCQWCGYPLLSRSYKKIDKTYKELQEERRYALGSHKPGQEPEPELEPEPEREPEPEPEREPEPEPVLEREPEPEPEPEREREPEPEPEPEPERKPEPEMESEPEPEPEPERKPEPEMESEREMKRQAVSALESKLEAPSGEIQVSVDELNSVYQANKQSANTKLTGKVLTVTGVVDKVFVRDHLDIRYIVLKGTERASVWSVRCTFGKESVSVLSRLSDRQPVAVRGKYDGYGKNIILKDCALVS
jgi:ribosomal protein L37E